MVEFLFNIYEGLGLTPNTEKEVLCFKSNEINLSCVTLIDGKQNIDKTCWKSLL